MPDRQPELRRAAGTVRLMDSIFSAPFALPFAELPRRLFRATTVPQYVAVARRAHTHVTGKMIMVLCLLQRGRPLSRYSDVQDGERQHGRVITETAVLAIKDACQSLHHGNHPTAARPLQLHTHILNTRKPHRFVPFRLCCPGSDTLYTSIRRGAFASCVEVWNTAILLHNLSNPVPLSSANSPALVDRRDAVAARLAARNMGFWRLWHHGFAASRPGQSCAATHPGA